ncbi:MAG: hypothetical protein WCE21_03455 [Candidatus Babeliales bacterium]
MQSNAKTSFFILFLLYFLIAANSGGLINYSYEHWHFSYGDRYAAYWSTTTGKKYARYGLADF